MPSRIAYELGAEQYAALLTHNQQRLVRQRWQWPRRIAYQATLMLVSAAVALLVGGIWLDSRGGNWLALALVGGIVLLGIQQAMFQKDLSRRIAEGSCLVRRPRVLEVGDDGLRWANDDGTTFIAWPAIQSLETACGHVLIYVDDVSFIPVPETAFASRAELADFLALLRERIAGAPAPTNSPGKVPVDVAVAGGGSTGRSGAWPGFLQYLRLGLRLAVFLPLPSRRPSASWSQFIALTALGIVLPVAEALLRVGTRGVFSAEGLPGALFHVPMMLFAAWCVACLAGRQRQTLALLTLLAAVQVAVEALYLLLFHASAAALDLLPRDWREAIYYLPPWWLALAFAGAAIRFLKPPAGRRLAVVAAAGLLLAVPPSVVYHDRSLWIEAHDEEAGSDFERKYLSLVAEEAFYLQPRLLERELAALKPGRPGVTDLYFVGAAGYSRQDVFMKEVRSVAELFRERFATEGRSVLLINNPQSVAESPIASTTSLGLTLRRIGAIMDRDEDILFLFLTSHGSPDHSFVLDFWPLRFNTLDPRRLRELLDEARIKRRVVVVSACHSGGFVDALQDDNTLVITAAAADRNSFGCSNEADFTYFGKAYFDEALRQTYSFVEAFEKARPVIAAREARENFPDSNPRLHVGEAIRRPLADFARARQAASAVPAAAKTKRPAVAGG
ncbi:MAG: C13 family peptidase [Defluviicoccus sp.]|nr:C13 family peptidase [Defluviicoccus sp.]